MEQPDRSHCAAGLLQLPSGDILHAGRAHCQLAVYVLQCWKIFVTDWCQGRRHLRRVPRWNVLDHTWHHIC
jgi:hypothetical protein